MKVCFYHQNFDIDVSSGTNHSKHQWHELCYAFGVTECAVINETKDDYKSVNDSIKIKNYKSLNQFLKREKGKKFFVEVGDHKSHRKAKIGKDDWVIIGGTSGIPDGLDGEYITIENAKTVLYPREAAAIVLAGQ